MKNPKINGLMAGVVHRVLGGAARASQSNNCVKRPRRDRAPRRASRWKDGWSSRTGGELISWAGSRRSGW